MVSFNFLVMLQWKSSSLWSYFSPPPGFNHTLLTSVLTQELIGDRRRKRELNSLLNISSDVLKLVPRDSRKQSVCTPLQKEQLTLNTLHPREGGLSRNCTFADCIINEEAFLVILEWETAASVSSTFISQTEESHQQWDKIIREGEVLKVWHFKIRGFTSAHTQLSLCEGRGSPWAGR